MTGKQQLIKYLENLGGKDKTNETWQELADRFGLPTKNVAEHCWRDYRKYTKLTQTAPIKEAYTANYIADLEDTIIKFEEDRKNNNASVEYKGGEEIKTEEDLIRVCKIDTEKWQIDKLVQNAWGSPGDAQKYQVKAWLSPKKVQREDFIASFLDSYKSAYKPLSKKDILINNVFGEPCCLEISLTDFHLDKGEIGGKTLEQKEEEFYATVDKLLFRTYQSHHIDEIVFMMGSDYFHTDSYHNTTTNGTPLDVNSSWDTAFEKGFEILANTIQKLKQFCNILNIILVSGNHDKTKSYYLAHSLATYFKSDENIVFNRTGANRKVYTYGNTFLGYHHGNCKIDELPLIFATEFGEQWGQCKYREVRTGDKHYNLEKKFVTQNEKYGVRIRQLPSLAGTDRWHNDNNFIGSIQAGIAMVYSKDKGKISEFEHRI